VLEAWYQQQLANPPALIGGTLRPSLRNLVTRSRGQYVDFAEFPPAKGRIWTPIHDGQLLLVQLDDYRVLKN